MDDLGAFYDIRCPKCQPRQEQKPDPDDLLEFGPSFRPDGVMLGCGLSYPEVCESIYHHIRKGKYGPEAKKAMRWMFRPAIYSSLEVYVCRDCGRWQTGDDVRICRLQPGRKEARGSYLDRERQRRVKANMKALCYLDPKEYDVVWQNTHPCRHCGGETAVQEDLKQLKCHCCGEPLEVRCTGHWD